MKRVDDLQRASEVFGPLGVNASVSGERNLGAAFGSDMFREAYVTQKVCNWVKNIEDLADIAKEQPQVAYSAYVKGISHKWAFIQWTMGRISHLFVSIDLFMTRNLGTLSTDFMNVFWFIS